MPLPDTFDIHSARLVVRSIAARDLHDLLAVNGDAEVTAFLPYATWLGLQDAMAWLQRMEALAATGTGRQLVLERKADRQVIGTLLAFKFDEGSARLELGYVVGRAHWRQGYAREALCSFVGHVFGDLGLRRVEAEVNPANVASNMLLSSIGFTHEGVLRQRWVGHSGPYDTNLYGLLRSEWAPPAMDGASPGR